MSDRELNIIIKADGSVAVRNLGAVDAAIQKTATTANTADRQLKNSGATIDGVGASAGATAVRLSGFTGRVIAGGESAAKLSGQIHALSGVIDKLTQSVDRAATGLEEMKGGSQNSSDAIKNHWRDVAVTVNQTLDILGKAKNFGSGVWDFAAQGAELQKARDSFQRFTSSRGVSGDNIISQLQQASGGTIEELTLIRKASSAMSLGVTNDVETMVNLMEIARNKGALMGRTTTEAFDDIVTGLGRMSPLILDNLGIRIPASFQETTKGMSNTQKMATLVQMTIKEGNKELAAMGGIATSTTDDMAAFEASISDVKREMGLLLSKALRPTIESLNTEVVPAIRNAITFWQDWIGVTDSQAEAFARMGKAGKIAQKEVFIATLEAEKARNLLLHQERFNRAATLLSDAQVSYNNAKTDGVSSDFSKSILLGGYNRAKTEFESAKAEMYAGVHHTNLQIRVLNEEIEKLKKSGPEAAGKLSDGVDEVGNAGEKTKKSLKEAKTAAEWFAGRGVETLDEVAAAINAVNAAAGGMASQLTKSTLEMAQMLHLAEAIKDALPKYMLGEKGGSFLESVMAGKNPNSHWSPSGAAEEIGSSFSDLFSWTWRSTTSEDLASWAKAKEKFRVDVAESFEAGLTDALEGGDFFESFGKSLRSQVVKAFAASVTANLFQGGGAFQVGGGAGSGFSILNPSTWISAAASAFSPQQSQRAQGASVGGLGGLLDFGPMMKGGQVRWGNLTQYAAAGAALQFLTSPGRLFGGTVVHGQEAVQQASDINSRVSQARTDRQALIGTVGLSEDTVKKLSDLVFWTAGYNKNESGDGWFKGPKTTTYELNATQANAALEEFTKLTKQAQIDLAKRAYEIGTTQLDRPFTALQMSLDDLREALTRTVDEESRYALQLQIKQAESQKQSFWAGNLNDWTSFGISTPMAGFGPKKKLSYGYEPAGEGTYPEPDSNRPWSIFDAVRDEASAASKAIWELYANPTGPYHIEEGEKALGYKLFNPADMAAEKLKGGFSVPEGKYVVNGTKLGVEEFESWAGTQIMTRGLRNQGSAAWDIQEQIARGAKPWDVEVDGQKYTDILTDRLGSYQTMLDELDEKISDETLTMAQRSQLFSQFTAALTAYYGAKQEALDLELQQEADLKNKRDQRTDDILGTLLSRVGEISTNKAGQQVIVLSPGQPDGRALAREIIDAIGGEKPELATALTQFLNQTAKPYF